MRTMWKRWLLAAALTVVAAAAVGLQVVGGSSGQALAGTKTASGAATGLGPLSGALPRKKLTLESAIKVDLSKETVRLPLYKGRADGKTVWYVLLDASDPGAAHNLGLNYAPKLANLGIGCPDCVQTVTIDSPSPADNPFGQAVVNFAGRAGLQPQAGRPAGSGRLPARAGPSRARWRARATARSSASPDRRPSTARRSSRPATGRSTSSTTRTRTIAHSAFHIAPKSPPGQYLESWVDLLFVKGFDAGQPIVYLSTDAGQPLSAVLERSTYVPALDKAAYNGGDDFLGSARERLFGFVNGQTGADNKQAQGFVHLVKDGHAAEDASAGNKALIDALRHGGDLLNVFGDFPTLKDPRHSEAYSPLWDAQLGQWTEKAIKQGLDKRQIDENVVFNLAATPARPDHRPRRRPLRRGRRRHQLRGDRLHEEGTVEEPRGARPQLAVPAEMRR